MAEKDVIQYFLETFGRNEDELFEALYLVILGKNSGPRLGSFMALLDKEWLQRRLNFQNK